MNNDDLIEYDETRLADVDQNILVEYGIVKAYEHLKSETSHIDKALFFKEETPRLLKLLSILDKEDENTLKIILTYLELRMDIRVLRRASLDEKSMLSVW